MLNIDIDFNEIPKNDIKFIHALIMTLKKYRYYNSYLLVMYVDGIYIADNGFDTKVFEDVGSLCNYILLLCGVEIKDNYNNLFEYYTKILKINFGNYDVKEYFNYYLGDKDSKVLCR